MRLADLALDDDWLASLADVAKAAGLAPAERREGLPRHKIARSVRALSDAYNTGDFARARTKEALAARLLFSFARDVPKIGAAVRELVAFSRLEIPRDGALRVLDVGAGLGASTWGLARMLALAGQRGAIDATLIDDDDDALSIARAIAKARTREGDVEVRVTTERARASVRSWPLRFDVILVGQSLGEIDADETKQVALLASLVDRALESNGSLVVVEPALRDRTRRLHRVRDALAATSSITIFAPCLHAEPCPALRDETSWCHEDLPIDLPRDVATIARAAGLRWQGLTFSYLVLRKDGVTLASVVAPRSQRVVSLPIVTKGKRELFFCGDGVIRKITRLDRDGEKRDAWSRASRGDVLAFEPSLGDEARVKSDVRIRIEPTS